MSTNYAIIGGDRRLVELAKMLANDKNMVFAYGQENVEYLKNIANLTICDNLEQAVENAEVIIGPIPISSEKNIQIQELMKYIGDKLFIAGNISEQIYKLAPSAKIVDIMNQEELTILNVIATAEGAIEVAISNTDKILHGSKVLLIGFGRISKILAKKLEGLSCKVTCSARKLEDIAWIKAYGYEHVYTNELSENLSQFDIIINTVPHLILDSKKLEYINRDSLLIDLASKPGGIDMDFAKKIGIKVVWALALPGKVAPLTSAKFIKETIYNIIKS